MEEHKVLNESLPYGDICSPLFVCSSSACDKWSHSQVSKGKSIGTTLVHMYASVCTFVQFTATSKSSNTPPALPYCGSLMISTWVFLFTCSQPQQRTNSCWQKLHSIASYCTRSPVSNMHTVDRKWHCTVIAGQTWQLVVIIFHLSLQPLLRIDTLHTVRWTPSKS